MRKTTKAAKLAATGALAMFIATGAFAAERGDQWQGRQDQVQQSQRADQWQGRQDQQQVQRADQWQGRQDQRQQSDRGQFNRQENRGQYGQRTEREHLSGVVTRVDYRDGMATVRDSGSRRSVRVDISQIGRRQLRRGDYVTLEGQWTRGNMFAAYRIENGR